MQENLQNKAKQIIERLKQINGSLSRRNRILIICGVIAVVVIAVAGALLLNARGNTVLFSALTQEEAVEIVSKINEMGVEASYGGENGEGVVTVPAEKAEQLRAQLVLQGYPKSGFSYKTYSDNVDMMSSDFDKNQYALFDLQDRVAATIRYFDGVSDAVVVFSQGDSNQFVLQADKKEPTAWATVYMKPGATLDDEQVKGIQQLLTKSVMGLSPENVSVFDNNGRDLTLAVGSGQGGGTARLKRALEMEFENSVASNLMYLLTPLYGEENLRISVRSSIDVKKKIQERITYTPATEDNKGVIDQESSGVEVVGDGTVAAGTPGTDTNARVPIYPDVTFDGQEIYYKDDATFDYLVSQMKEQIQDDGGDVLDISVSAVINSDGLSNAEKNEVQDLIAMTAGISADLQDEKVAVYARNFDQPTVAAGGGTLEMLIQSALEWKWVLLGIVAATILLLVLLTIFDRKRRRARKLEATEEAYEEDDQLLSIKLEDIKKTREMELKEQIKDFANNNPEISAQLIRTWLKGGGENGD